MFSSRELVHYNLPMCPYCVHQTDTDMCCRKNKWCNFVPQNWNSYIQLVVNNLKLQSVPCRDRKMLIRNAKKQDGTVAEGNFTLDTYYCQLVNDSLWLLRHGQCAYVFSLSHIIDILRFEPDIEVQYLVDSNSFCITKPRT